MTETRNGHITSRTFLGAVGILVTIIIALSGFFVGRANGIDTKLDNALEDGSQRAERISSLEARTTNLEKQYSEILARLDTILIQIKRSP